MSARTENDVAADRIASMQLANRMMAFIKFQGEGHTPLVVSSAAVIAAARLVAQMAPRGEQAQHLVSAGDHFFAMAENYPVERQAPGTLI